MHKAEKPLKHCFKHAEKGKLFQKLWQKHAWVVCELILGFSVKLFYQKKNKNRGAGEGGDCSIRHVDCSSIHTWSQVTLNTRRLGRSSVMKCWPSCVRFGDGSPVLQATRPQRDKSKQTTIIQGDGQGDELSISSSETVTPAPFFHYCVVAAG